MILLIPLLLANDSFLTRMLPDPVARPVVRVSQGISDVSRSGGRLVLRTAERGGGLVVRAVPPVGRIEVRTRESLPGVRQTLGAPVRVIGRLSQRRSER